MLVTCRGETTVIIQKLNTCSMHALCVAISVRFPISIIYTMPFTGKWGKFSVSAKIGLRVVVVVTPLFRYSFKLCCASPLRCVAVTRWRHETFSRLFSLYGSELCFTCAQLLVSTSNNKVAKRLKFFCCRLQPCLCVFYVLFSLQKHFSGSAADTSSMA